MTDEADEMSAASRGSGANYSAFPNSWIPVTERLPQDDENVLVFDPKCHGAHIAWCHKDSTGEIVWASQVYYGLEPTHWMPLPATPTDGK